MAEVLVLALSFSIKQENVFGTGNYLGVEVNTSKYNRTLAINSVDPYFTADGISRTADLYYRTAFVFQTGAPAHLWLTESQFVGMARPEPGLVCIRVFRLR